MKTKIGFLLMFVILVGCSPQKRIARLLERFPLDSSIVIEYRDTTIYKDTTIFERIPGDTVWRDTILPVEVDLPYMELKTRSSLAEARAWILDNRLGLELIQYDTIFVFKLDSALSQDIDTMFVVNNIPYPVIEKIGKFWMHGFLVLAGLILLGLILFFLLRR